MIACQTGSGIWFIISYNTYFLIVSGLNVNDAFKYNIMATCFGFLGVNMGMYLMKRHLGRRSILILGGCICGLSQLAFAIAGTVSPGSIALQNCLIAFTTLFKWGYNMCVGAARQAHFRRYRLQNTNRSKLPRRYRARQYKASSMDCGKCNEFGLFSSMAQCILYPIFYQPRKSWLGTYRT